LSKDEIKDDCNQCGGTIDGWVYKDFIIAYSKLNDIVRQKKKITADDIRQCMTWEVGSRPCELFAHEFLMNSFVLLSKKYPNMSKNDVMWLALARLAHKYNRAFMHTAKRLRFTKETIENIKSTPKEKLFLDEKLNTNEE